MSITLKQPTWHIAEPKECDTVVVEQEDVEGVQRPSGLHQQARPQGHHEPESRFKLGRSLALFPNVGTDLIRQFHISTAQLQ